MQPYTDVLFSTSGPVRNVSVTVKTSPGGAVANIFSDNGVTPTANPLTTGNDGRFLFYAADGFYTITVSGAGITTATIGPILLQDYSTTSPVASKLAAPTGSSLVGFIAAGTGAVAFTVQNQLRKFTFSSDWTLNAQYTSARDALTGTGAFSALDLNSRLTFIGPLTANSGGDTHNDIRISRSGTTVVTAGEQTDLIRIDGTYTLTGAGVSIQGVHVNLTASSSSTSVANMHAVIGTVFNSGAGETKGVYGAAYGKTGSTGVLVGVISAIGPASGTTSSYGYQLTLNSDGSVSGGDGIGSVPSAGYWLVAGNGAATAHVKRAFRIDQSVLVDNAAFSMDAAGSGDFLELRNSAGSAYLFRTLSTGATTITNTSSGAATTPLVLVNSSGSASTETILEIQPSTTSVRTSQISAINNGSNVISMAFRLSNGASPATVVTLDAGANTISALKSTIAHNATAIPAGGTAGAGIMFSSTANFGIFFGSGAPTLSAAKGSLYLRSNGTTTNDRAYINTDGGTTWTALTTAA